MCKPCANSQVNTIAEYFLLKIAVNQRQSQKHGLNSLVCLMSQTTL